jgi:hypothetical protein
MDFDHNGEVFPLITVLSIPQAPQCAYPIELILNNRSAQISKETRAWLAIQRLLS